MSSAANINKLKMITSSSFIALRWRTAKLLITFYLEKIYYESLRTVMNMSESIRVQI